MAELSYSCDVSQGFNFQGDFQKPVGHINTLSIAGNLLAEDLTIPDPENWSAETTNVVGVVSDLYWEGGYADSVQFTCQVSNANKNTLAAFEHSAMSDILVEFSFTIYDFSPEDKKYYQCLHTGGQTLNGSVEKSKGVFSMDIDTEESVEVAAPRNFSFSLGVMPQDIAQEIHLAMSAGDKLVKRWGVGQA
jgi:hypothetical protein